MLMHECDAVAGLAAQLEHLRKIDPLTHFANKRSFAERVDED
jgi:GGDEF domain-containing protein